MPVHLLKLYKNNFKRICVFVEHEQKFLACFVQLFTINRMFTIDCLLITIIFF